MIINAVDSDWKSFSVDANDTKSIQNQGMGFVYLYKGSTKPALTELDFFLMHGGMSLTVSGQATFWVRSKENNTPFYVED